MNSENIIKSLQEKYPGKYIICLPKDNPTEILCEIDPTEKHADYSTAVAVITRSTPHFHLKTTEVYEVLEGELVLHLADKVIKLSKGESCTIKPGQIHWAEGKEAWIKVSSKPGWTEDDHKLVQ